MSLFNDLLHYFKEKCDEKDKEIEMLNNEITLLREERSLVVKRFKEGEYTLLTNYLNIGVK